MSIACVIQARTSSTRLPNKILTNFSGKPMLIHIIERLLNSEKIDCLIVATTDSKKDDGVEDLILNYNNSKVKVFRGSENDVLDRFYKATIFFNIDNIIRITADCPMIDYKILDLMIDKFHSGQFDYLSNVLPKRTFPRGLDVEIFTFKILEFMWKNCSLEREREHVTTYIREHPENFKIFNFTNKNDLSSLRWTVDEYEDLLLVKEIYKNLYDKNKYFDFQDILNFLDQNPELSSINKHIEQKKSVENDAN